MDIQIVPPIYKDDGTTDGGFDLIFCGTLLDLELGTICGSNDSTKLGPLLGTSEGDKYGTNDGVLDGEF